MNHPEGSSIESREARVQSAHVAQLVERVLGKDEVISSILIMGSSFVNLAVNLAR